MAKASTNRHRRGSRSVNRRLKTESLECRYLLTAEVSPWHNIALPGDVNNDGSVNGADTAHQACGSMPTATITCMAPNARRPNVTAPRRRLLPNA